MIRWTETTESRFDEMLGVVPPAIMWGNGFLVGEAFDHDRAGRPRYAAFIQVRGTFYESAHPMTVADFKACAHDVPPNDGSRL
jgi:hypothetical protein